MKLPKQVSIREASNIYSIPIWTLRKYVTLKLIPHRRVRSKVYIPIARFEEWLEQGDVEPHPTKTKLQKKVKKRILIKNKELEQKTHVNREKSGGA